MDREKLEKVDEDAQSLAKRGNDEGIPFEEPWRLCHVQNCMTNVSYRPNTRLYTCRSVEGGCENLEEVWCCCELFRYNKSDEIPEEDRIWEHIPGGKDGHRADDEDTKYQCFCVYTYPWDEEIMEECKKIIQKEV